MTAVLSFGTSYASRLVKKEKSYHSAKGKLSSDYHAELDPLLYSQNGEECVRNLESY